MSGRTREGGGRAVADVAVSWVDDQGVTQNGVVRVSAVGVPLDRVVALLGADLAVSRTETPTVPKRETAPGPGRARGARGREVGRRLVAEQQDEQDAEHEPVRVDRQGKPTKGTR